MQEYRFGQHVEISEAMYEFSMSKPDGDMSDNLNVEEKTRLEELIERLCRYNQEYEHSQLIRRESLKSKNSNISRQNSGNLEETPGIVKNSSKISSSSVKSKKIKRVVRRKPTTRAQERQQEEEQTVKVCRRRVGRQVSKVKEAQKEEESEERVEEVKYEIKPQERELQTSRGYDTRLRKNESASSEKPLLEEFSLPDFLLNTDSFKKSSSVSSTHRLRSNSNSNIFFHSPGFVSNSTTNSNLLIGPSPKGHFRNWTPLCPSPNMGGDILTRGNYSFKTDNEDLDNVMNELRRKIEENT